MMKKGKKKTLILGLAAAAAAGIVCMAGACRERSAFSAVREQEPEFILTYAENQPQDYPTTQAAYRFAQLVQEETRGRIRIKIFPDGALGSETEVLKQLRYGGIDFARLSVMSLGDEIPVLNVLQLPYLYRDSEHMWKVLDGDTGEVFMEAFEDYGLKGLSWYDAGARHFYNSGKPVECLEDMRDLKIRVAQSEMMEDMVRALGAQPVIMDYSEVYGALETGQIDGAENNWPSYDTMRHFEMAPYITLDGHNRIPEIQAASGETWEKLSQEDQAIIRSCARESALYERRLWKEREDESRKKLEAAGCQVTVLNEREQRRFEAMAKTVYKDFAKGYEELIDRIDQVQ